MSGNTAMNIGKSELELSNKDPLGQRIGQVQKDLEIIGNALGLSNINLIYTTQKINGPQR